VIDDTWEEITRPSLSGTIWTYWDFRPGAGRPLPLRSHVRPRIRKLNFKVYNDDRSNPPSQFDGRQVKTYVGERKQPETDRYVEPGMPRMSEVGSWMEVSYLIRGRMSRTGSGGCRTRSPRKRRHQEYR